MRTIHCLVTFFGFGIFVSLTIPALAEPGELAKQLRELSAAVQLDEDGDALRSMLREHIRGRLRQASRASTSEWREIENLDDWKRFRDEKVAALRASLGRYPQPPDDLRPHVTRKIEGDGLVIENVVFQSRPGIWVTANLYSPAEPRESMPGILICHSHHRPKTHGELQDMGMTWARAGCVVLVMDQLGHGERRQHPFASAADYEGEFRVSRQDYYFRYDNGMQLHLAGDSLIGWMAWDLSRGVDLLLSRKGVDPKRIILLGAVAGGGDPAAVAAAVDERIRGAVPFNFGGPQPETKFPLPEDPEDAFNYTGSGSWESTRNLRLSARHGFVPWVIVAATAPRYLIYAHEFSWDREHDPVWDRLQQIYRTYAERERLSYTHGFGTLRGTNPRGSHCTHIGRVHRKMIHPAFERWFDIEMSEEKEYSNRLDDELLLAWTPELAQKLKPRKLADALPELACERLNEARSARRGKPLEEQRAHLRRELSRVLGPIAPPEGVTVRGEQTGKIEDSGRRLVRFVLQSEPGIVVPGLLLLPGGEKPPAGTVIGVAQSGKAAFLQDRSEAIATLLEKNIAVCLPDLRGTEDTAPDGGRGRYSSATALSSSELMLGGTVVGGKLRDLRTVIRYLQAQEDLAQGKLGIWGESFAPANAPGTDFKVPRRIGGRPRQSEPLGGMLALLAALYEDEVDAVFVHRGLSSFASTLSAWQMFIPHDVIVPELLTVGDLADVAAALAPRPLMLSRLVDERNAAESEKLLEKEYALARRAYRAAGEEKKIELAERAVSPADWLAERLR